MPPRRASMLISVPSIVDRISSCGPADYDRSCTSAAILVFSARAPLAPTSLVLRRGATASGHSSEVSPLESRGRFRKCSAARMRGWSGYMQESEKVLKSLSSSMSLMIAARVSGCTSLKAISQITLWPKSPQARASPPSEMNANTATRMQYLWHDFLTRPRGFLCRRRARRYVARCPARKRRIGGTPPGGPSAKGEKPR